MSVKCAQWIGKGRHAPVLVIGKGRRDTALSTTLHYQQGIPRACRNDDTCCLLRWMSIIAD